MYEISSYMKTFFGSMYEISSYYDRDFLIHGIFISWRFHDPCFLIQPQYPLYLFLISRVVVDPELAAGGEEEITDKSCKMRYAQVSQVAYFLLICFSCKVFKT